MILGEGQDEQQELRHSVAAVANRHSKWSYSKSQLKVEQLNVELKRSREAEARAFEKLCAIREQETFQHPTIFGGYEGTLCEIASQVRKESKVFGWFTDRLPDSVNLIEQPPPDCPIKQKVCVRLLELMRSIDPMEEQRAHSNLLSLDEIPSAEEFRTLVHAEQKANILFEDRRQNLSHPAYEVISGLNTSELYDLYNKLDDFYSRLRKAENSDSEWEWRATKEVLRGNVAALEALQNASYGLLDHMQKEVKEIGDLEVKGLEGRSQRSILQDANELKAHVEQGGKFGFWVFRPSVVKQSLYLIQDVTVDGRQCCTIELLDKLISWLYFHESAKKLHEQWANLTTVATDHLPLNQAIGHYRQLQSKLDVILELGKQAEELNRRLDTFDRGIARSWYELEAVNKLRGLVDAIIAQRDLEKSCKSIEKAELKVHSVCGQSNTAPENFKLRNAIRNRLIDDYTSSFEELVRLWRCRKSYEERDQLWSEVNRNLPELSQELRKSILDPEWDGRISNLERAWNWVCADEWLAQMADPSLEDTLNQQIRQSRREMSAILAKLAAEKAWQYCMKSMTEGSFQSLMAWRKAIERLGKGTGKYAERNRRLAKERLEECRGAIPAWVMPIYKVLETVTVQPGVFDVVIIDEASQSGPDALFLAFLAKQLVVVGDDQQIRPENVGIDHNDVHQLQKRYLHNIPKWDIFGATESLFSIAEVRFGNPIRLREHFRCMPEIISFSNRLCYQDQPLIPLRQFGCNRLTPVLQTHYVSGGYQEQRKVNPVEADAIVDAIEQCCEDPTYSGKTFGVISLLHSSDQDREIESRLIKRLDAEEIEQRNIVCGDAYDFQGDERDVIFLSMVSTRSVNARIATMSDERAKRRFNVAISRACDQLMLFHSIQEGELGQSCLRRRLLSHMKQPTIDPTAQLPYSVEELRQLVQNTPRSRGNQPAPFDSWFEVDVFLSISGQGYLAIPQYEVHGYRIDIVIIGGTRKVAVECDGDVWHNAQNHAHDLHRQSQLERCNWEFFRIRGSRYYRDPEGSLLPLWKMLEISEEASYGDNKTFSPDEDLTEEKSLKENDANDKSQPEKDAGYKERAGKNIENHKEGISKPAVTLKKYSRSSVKPRGTITESQKNLRTPKPLEKVLAMPNRELGRVICEILEERPNYSAKKDDLTKYVSKYFDIITRATPRNQLKKKIGWALTNLKKAGKVEEYKAKNIRVRLVRPSKQGKLF